MKDVVIFGETIKAHERIQVEQSLKYSQAAATKLWNTAGLTEADKWELDDEYGKSIPVSYYTVSPLPQISGGNPWLFLSPAAAAAAAVGRSYDAPRLAGIKQALVTCCFFDDSQTKSNPYYPVASVEARKCAVGCPAWRHEKSSKSGMAFLSVRRQSKAKQSHRFP